MTDARAYRWLLVCCLLFLALPGALSGQATGTWRLQLHDGARTVRGRLSLTETESGITGELLLETNDSAPTRLSGTVGAHGAIQLRVASSPVLTLAGTLQADQLAGVVVGEEGRRTWSAERLRQGAEYYPSPPRFRMREIVPDEHIGASRVSGVGSAAALAAGDSAGAVVVRYRALSVRAGLEPLDRKALRTSDLLFAMGLYRRSELLRASHSVLEEIRSGLANDTLRARFDYLFRPRGEWIVDIHDAARARVIQKFPAFTWAALSSVTTLPEVAGERLPSGADEVPFGLYRLYVLSMNDPQRYTLRLEELRREDASAAAGVERYVQAYTEAAEWYRSVIEFFMARPWFEGRSLSDVIAGSWPWALELPIPAIRTQGYGYPEGSPRVMPAPGEVERLLVPENWSAREWLASHGTRAVLEALGDLPREPSNTVVEDPEGSWVVTSVAQRRTEAPTGFLEPENAVVLDPSYVPTLALGTVVHEWLHVLHERRRPALSLRATAAGDTLAAYRAPATLPAEGLAEWLSEVIMAPVIMRYPLLGLGESAKRATMALTRPDDPHMAGYLIARNVAAILEDRSATIALLLAAMNDPDSVVRHHRVAMAWAPYRDRVTTLIEVTPPRWLVPETTFIIDDRAVFILRRRILPTAP